MDFPGGRLGRESAWCGGRVAERSERVGRTRLGKGLSGSLPTANQRRVSTQCEIPARLPDGDFGLPAKTSGMLIFS